MKQHILENPNEFKETILCLDEAGNKIGDLSVDEVLERAEKDELDAVVISKNPNVVKIMDFGKFKYKQEKKEKEQKKNHLKVEDKEIQFSLNIAKYDFDIKMKKAIGFLEKKKRVTFKLRLRGRENTYTNEAMKIMEEAIKAAQVVEGVKVVAKPKAEGTTIQMVIAA